MAGVRTTSLWTLVSRLLGMVRDMATAALFGASGSAVADAFVVAFRIPNLFRRLFGEGALTASFVPVFAARLEEDRRTAWQVASVALTWLSLALLLIVAIGELVCLALAWHWQDDPQGRLLAGLSAAMLPYVFFVCLTAQLSAMLHAVGEFRWPGIAPSILNVTWIVGAGLAAWLIADDMTRQAYWLAAAVLVGGVLQLGVQLPALRRAGFRYDYNWPAARDSVRRIALNAAPMMLGLAVGQINALVSSFLALGLAATPGESDVISWLGPDWRYPLEQGAAAALYFAERLYQFPIGLIGVAVATVIFPLLSRHAHRQAWEQIGDDLTLGLRLVLFLAIPAGVGLTLLAEPITALLFQRGEFTAEDTARTARLIALYGYGVWALCALPVLVRGFYALGDPRTPLRVGMSVVALNLALNLLLIWPLAEAGLVLASVAATAVQTVALAAWFSRRHPLRWRDLAVAAVRALLASAGMGIAGWLALKALSGDYPGHRLLQVAAPALVCLAVYFLLHRLLGGRELGLLLGREAAADPPQR